MSYICNLCENLLQLNKGVTAKQVIRRLAKYKT